MECVKCGHKWKPQITNLNPKYCPKCKNPPLVVPYKKLGRPKKKKDILPNPSNNNIIEPEPTQEEILQTIKEIEEKDKGAFTFE